MNARSGTVAYHSPCLLRKINRHFNADEVKTLCFLVEVDCDNLGGEGKLGKIRELLLYLERVDRVPALVESCRELREKVQWDDCLDEAPEQPAAAPRGKRRAAQDRKRPLQEVPGIGPTFAARLHRAGVDALAQLVDLDVAGLTEILESDGRAEDILLAARRLHRARRPHRSVLVKINGIGPARADTLHRKGVDTFQELLELDPGELQEALQISRRQAVSFQEEARQQMKDCRHKREAFALQAVDGIGPTYAVRLCRAGVDTAAELLQLDVPTVAAVLHVGTKRAMAILEAAERVAISG